MKYSDMSRAIQADRHAKATGRKDASDPILEPSAFERSPADALPVPAPPPPLGEPVHGATLPLSVNVEAEDWLLERLKQHGCDPYDHAAVFACNRDRLRTTILNNGISRAICGRHDGKPENYRECFERLYGEPLDPPSRKTKS
jgi:hypothetical protein